MATGSEASRGSPTPSPQGATNEDDSSIKRMALYSLERARTALSNLSHHPTWTNADTASFDCMHYDGDRALDHCASKLDIQPGQHILDIGSGFSATGRFLASKYHVDVTGVELQMDVHELAKRIIAKNAEKEVVEGVKSVNADILTVELGSLSKGGSEFDHVVSLLCICHIPQASRRPLFRQVARFLKPGGKLYVEDFYGKGVLTKKEKLDLENVVACPYLPTATEFTAEVEAAGLDVVEFEDVSEHWKSIVVARAEDYKGRVERDADLENFYDTVAELFTGGNVGGVRMTSVKR